MKRHFRMPTFGPPRRKAVLELLDELGVLKQNDHLVYAAGDHGSDYFQKDLILTNPYATSSIGFHIAQSLVRAFPNAILIGPASAGIGLVQIVCDAAARLNPDGDYRALYAEKDGVDVNESDRFSVKRNTKLLDLDLPLIGIEDVLTTGKSIRSVNEAVTRYNGRRFETVRCICNRGVTAMQLDVVDLDAFLTLDLPKYAAKDCPLCKSGVPINMELGHGKKFVELHGQPSYAQS